MIRLPLIIALLFLVGCTSYSDLQPTDKVIQMRHSAYLGKKIGLFILDVGAPPYAKSVSSEKIIYAWNSRNHLSYPQLLHEEDDYWIDGECEVHIYTKLDGRIYAIYALEDSAKHWDIDVCAKYLK